MNIAPFGVTGASPDLEALRAGFRNDAAHADLLDAQDALAPYRERFLIPRTTEGDEVIYFCGNSLGLQPVGVRPAVEEMLDDWARLGVEGHFHARLPWMPYHERLAHAMRAIVGAETGEVVVMNTLTVNLHLMMVSFYRPTPQRRKIVIEHMAFPSDRYAAASQLAWHGFDPATDLIEVTPRPGEDVIRTEDIESLLAREGESIALVLLGGVNYYTGQFFDIARITRAAHACGVVAGFDLAHAAGNVPLHLHDDDVDFAVWCSYKYLNGGPGTTAGCFVHARHARAGLPRFTGWWGQNAQTRFEMLHPFDPIEGAEGWQVSNPAILPMAALGASLTLFAEAGMDALHAKSLRLTAYLEYLLAQHPSSRWHLITPRDPMQRGAQLSVRIIEDGRSVFDRLSAEGIICDWREPDVIRLAPVPLYNSFREVYRFAAVFHRAIAS